MNERCKRKRKGTEKWEGKNLDGQIVRSSLSRMARSLLSPPSSPFPCVKAFPRRIFYEAPSRSNSVSDRGHLINPPFLPPPPFQRHTSHQYHLSHDVLVLLTWYSHRRVARIRAVFLVWKIVDPRALVFHTGAWKRKRKKKRKKRKEKNKKSEKVARLWEEFDGGGGGNCSMAR